MKRSHPFFLMRAYNLHRNCVNADVTNYKQVMVLCSENICTCIVSAYRLLLWQSSNIAGRGLGEFGGKEDVIYWKCEEGQLLEEVLTVPMTNIRREEALITAAHQQMTEMEYERRRVTGTLNSSTITTKAVELLTVGGKLQHTHKQPRVCSDIDLS